MLINGESASSISVLDRGLQYGDGLFETIAVKDGVPCLWQRHLDRLIAGCQKLQIPLPDTQLLQNEVLQVTQGQPNGICKITLTRGVGGRGYRPSEKCAPTRIVAAFDHSPLSGQERQEGVVVRICDTRLGHNAALAGLKHLNRLEQVLARLEWQGSAVYEGLMLDDQGWVIEGTMSNLFLLEDDCLVTPDLTRCGVSGVMRSLVLDVAQEMDLKTRIDQVSLECLDGAEALFLSNSIIGLIPIRQLGARSFDVTNTSAKLIAAVMQSAFKG